MTTKNTSELQSKIFFTSVLVAVIFLASFVILFSADRETPIIPTPPSSGFTCPNTDWVDCMPSVPSTPRPQCQPEFLSWATENCPGFQGAAL